MKNNMGYTDKIVRYILAVIFLTLYFTNIAKNTFGTVLLILAVVLVVTNFINFCPLYTLLKINTNKKKEMKKIIFILTSVLINIAAIACPVCERNKKNALLGLTHGSNPESNWDYVIVLGMIVIAITTLFYSIKWLIKPNENNKAHIKYSFLTEQ